VVHLPKKEPGLEFPDLDLLTKLLQPRQTPKVDLKATAQRCEVECLGRVYVASCSLTDCQQQTGAVD